MNKKEKVTEYVEGIIQLYQLNPYGLLTEYNEDEDCLVEVPLFPYDEIDDETLKKITLRTGLTKREILSTDEKAATKYWDKFRFFDLNLDYQGCTLIYSKYRNEEEAKVGFLRSLCGIDEYAVGTKYDVDSIYQRMIEQLVEIDSVMPGTMHENAEITNLSIQTESCFSFPEIGTMITAFMEIVEHADMLFKKVLYQETMSEDEINEYNFLINWLDARDLVAPAYLINYDLVSTCRDAYIEEGCTDILSCARIKRWVDSSPWRCKEFFDDMELVKKFVEIFPDSKAKMRQFSMDVTKFKCIFVWSDAEPIVFSDETEEEDMLTGDYIPLDQRAKKRTEVYVKKNTEEMYGYEEYAQKIHKMSLPESKGGIPAKERINRLDIRKIERRINLMHKGGKANG